MTLCHLNHNLPQHYHKIFWLNTTDTCDQNLSSTLDLLKCGCKDKFTVQLRLCLSIFLNGYLYHLDFPPIFLYTEVEHIHCFWTRSVAADGSIFYSSGTGNPGPAPSTRSYIHTRHRYLLFIGPTSFKRFSILPLPEAVNHLKTTLSGPTSP